MTPSLSKEYLRATASMDSKLRPFSPTPGPRVATHPMGRLLVLLMLLVVSCDRSEPAAQDLLGGEACSYWDANVGYNYAFARDGTCYEYTYNDQGKRERADYGDVRIDHFDWHVAGNQLHIEAGEYRRTFDIIRFTRTEMVLQASNDYEAEGLPERVWTKASD
jgi:hypothetical protein